MNVQLRWQTRSSTHDRAGYSGLQPTCRPPAYSKLIKACFDIAFLEPDSLVPSKIPEQKNLQSIYFSLTTNK